MNTKDYKKIRTPFVFFDETGSINDATNRYFGLGMVKCMQPYYLDTAIRNIRQKYHFYDEIKWNTITKVKWAALSDSIDVIFATPGIKFSAVIINKDTVDFHEEFNDNPYEAYQVFSEFLLTKSLHNSEILIVLADYMTTPPGVHFEVDLKHHINKQQARLAVAGVHRVDSRGLSLLQVTDLLLGATMYEYKLKNKLVKGSKYKLKTLQKIREHLQIKSLINCSLNTFKVLNYQPIKKGHHPNG
ncbi:MAG: DUF3800 domain-containing protein [bacterium]